MTRIPLCRPVITSEVTRSLRRVCGSKQAASSLSDSDDGWTMHMSGVVKQSKLPSEWDRLRELAKRGADYREMWGADHLIGVDEAGRGCWAGPVVAAAARIPIQTLIEGVKDSKKLSEKARVDILCRVLNQPDVKVAVDLRHPKEIDATNILAATRLAMRTAAGHLRDECAAENSKAGVLVDGRSIVSNPRRVSATASVGVFCELPAAEVVSGDNFHQEIALASVTAKTIRDGCILLVGDSHPEYEFERHRGYGTALHRRNLLQHGALRDIHRKSFRPMSEMTTWVV